MDKQELFEQIKKKKSFLCIGLDPDISKFPPEMKGIPSSIFGFNRAIIDATADLCVAYKPNLAFYESQGMVGMEKLYHTVEYIRHEYPDILIIADAKRGDIGNTSDMYAKAIFDTLGADAITVAPYMGEDSVVPFLKYEGKWTILLALTSNKGADDFQTLITGPRMRLYEKVLKTSQGWGTDENMMYVIGATQAKELANVRRIVPDHFLLVPGVGAQGGSLQEVAKYGMNSECGLLVNSSRQILYASNGSDFAEAARTETFKVQQEMGQLLQEAGLI